MAVHVGIIGMWMCPIYAGDHSVVFMGTHMYMCRCMYIGYTQVLARVDVQVYTGVFKYTQLYMQVKACMVMHKWTQVLYR